MAFRHGTRTGYTYHHCPCDRCRAAHAAYKRRYKQGVRLRIDPAPARDHITALRAEGWTLAGIARTTGYHVQTIRNIALGKTAYADVATVEDICSIPVEAHTMPARKHGSTGLVIDVSGIRTASTRRDA